MLIRVSLSADHGGGEDICFASVAGAPAGRTFDAGASLEFDALPWKRRVDRSPWYELPCVRGMKIQGLSWTVRVLVTVALCVCALASTAGVPAASAKPFPFPRTCRTFTRPPQFTPNTCLENQAFPIHLGDRTAISVSPQVVSIGGAVTVHLHPPLPWCSFEGVTTTARCVLFSQYSSLNTYIPALSAAGLSVPFVRFDSACAPDGLGFPGSLSCTGTAMAPGGHVQFGRWIPIQATLAVYNGDLGGPIGGTVSTSAIRLRPACQARHGARAAKVTGSCQKYRDFHGHVIGDPGSSNRVQFSVAGDLGGTGDFNSTTVTDFTANVLVHCDVGAAVRVTIADVTRRNGDYRDIDLSSTGTFRDRVKESQGVIPFLLRGDFPNGNRNPTRASGIMQVFPFDLADNHRGCSTGVLEWTAKSTLS